MTLYDTHVAPMDIWLCDSYFNIFEYWEFQNPIKGELLFQDCLGHTQEEWFSIFVINFLWHNSEIKEGEKYYSV